MTKRNAIVSAFPHKCHPFSVQTLLLLNNSFVHPFAHLSVLSPICPSLGPFVRPFAHLSISWPICPSFWSQSSMPPSTNVYATTFDNICENHNKINNDNGDSFFLTSVPLMAQQKKTSKIGANIRPAIVSIGRHNSEQNLAKRTTLSEFLCCWNRSEALSVRCRPVPIFPLCHRMLFHRRINDAQQQQFIQCPKQQQQQQQAKAARRKQQQMATSTALRLRQPGPSVGPSPRLSPPSSSSNSSVSSTHRFVLNRSDWRGKACPDGDLLPASWFMLSSEDLFQLHQKLQRRIDRRRSLTKANFPFGEANRRQANILQKYRRFPADVLRRSLSDHHICFMDPKRDVEAPITRGPKTNSWSASSKASSPSTNGSKKRVSFSTMPTIVPPPTTAVDDDAQTETVGTQMGNGQSAKECRPSPPPSAHSVVPLPSPSTTPVKPILARKLDPCCSPSSLSVSATVAPNSVADFRRRINTVTNICEDDSLCAMDYATFRAWRRGSRLSIDVLNGANGGRGAGAVEVQNAADADKMLSKSAAGTARIDAGGWAQLVKRILDDCFRQRKGKRRNGEGRKLGAEEEDERKEKEKA